MTILKPLQLFLVERVLTFLAKEGKKAVLREEVFELGMAANVCDAVL